MQRVVIIGKLYNTNKLNGPGNVIYNLQQAFLSKNVDVEYIFRNEKNNWFSVIRDIITNVLFKKNKSINVHTDGFILVFLIYLISLVNKKNQYYLTVHGIYKIESAMSKTTKHKYLILEKMLYKRFNNLICVSSKLAKDIEEIYGRRKNVHIIHNGVQNFLENNSDYIENLDDNNMNFIFVGGINIRKGIFETLQTFKYIVENSNIQMQLNIYGQIENESVKSQYDQYIKRYKLEKNVAYHGVILDKAKLFGLYKKATFHLCLSLYDTFNVAILESMSVGCPCIISDRCGAKDLITHQQNGYVVSFENNMEENVFKIIEEVQMNSEKFKKLRVLSKEIAQENTWDIVANNYYNLLIK